MKKQLFILLSLIALLVTAQVPQRFNKVIVTGDIVSPKFIRTGSTVDSVLLGNGSARSVNSIKTDTASLSKRINLKQDALPFPEVRTGDTFLNDLGTFSAPPSSGGGSASGTPVYFWPTNSPTSGYLELDYTPYSSVVENSYSIPVGTTLLSSHLIDLQVATTTIDAGNWYISSRSKVNNLSGSTKLHVDFFLYHLDGTTTVLFGSDSETFSTTDYKIYQGQLPEASFPCTTTDRLGVSIYAINSGGSTKTLTISLGNGIATFFSSPLRIRHSNLRDKNGEAAFQHLTSEQVSIVNATSGTNTGDETKTTIRNKLGAASYTNSGYLTSTEWGEFKGKVTFPGFGTSHTTAAYGDHLHTGIYEVPLTFSTGLTRTGNTITNNITQYTDAMARSAQLTANSTTTGLLTSSDWNIFNNKQPAGSYAPASGSVNYVQIQNSSAQSGNMWINGKIRNSITNNASFISNWGGLNWFGIGSTTANHLIRLGMTDVEGVFQNAPGDMLFQVDGSATFASTINATQLQSTVATGTAPLTVNSTTMVSNLNAQYFNNQSINNFNYLSDHYITDKDANTIIGGYGLNTTGNGTGNSNFPYKYGTVVNYDVGYGKTQLHFNMTGELTIRSYWEGWKSNRKIYDSINLTNDLTTNYIPKWNGSNFVNAAAGTDYQLPITLTTNGTSGVATFSGGVLNVPNYSGNIPASSKSNSMNLTNSDCYVTVNADNAYDIIVNLPDPTTGKVFYIKSNVSNNVRIYPSATYYFNDGYTANLLTVGITRSQTLMIVWDGHYWSTTNLN